MLSRDVLARQLEGLRQHLPALVRHHHPEVRAAARAAAVQLGLEAGPEYREVDGLDDDMRKWLDDLVSVLPARVAPNAKWVTFERPQEWGDGSASRNRGFMLANGPKVDVLGWTGERFLLAAQECKLADARFADAVGELLLWRDEFNGVLETPGSGSFEKKREIAGRFGPPRRGVGNSGKWEGAVPDAFMAAFALRSGDAATAARLIVPLLAEQRDARWFALEISRRLAATLDMTMLQAFVARDYERAAVYARLLVKPFFAGRFQQERAQRLLAQLPRREVDFRGLSLPTATDWSAMKAKMSRGDQIAFLLARLRLMRGQQDSNPGGIEYDGFQGDSINPFNELMAMDLTGSDLELVLPALNDRDYLLAFSRFRFAFHEAQDLAEVRWLARAIVDLAAREELVRPDLLDATPKERDQHVAELAAWCKAHANEKQSERPDKLPGPGWVRR